ncbi:MAG: hypothetical protein ACUVV0_09245 [Anaerolineae bacterium]
MFTVRSKNQVLIRLPEERWLHITEEHAELAGHLFDVLETVDSPETIYEGCRGEFLAVKSIAEGKFLVVIYRELSPTDGFIITAFITKRKGQLERRRKIWP